MGDREKLRALLDEARPTTDPALYKLLGLILEKIERLEAPHEAVTARRATMPLFEQVGKILEEGKK